MAVTVQEAPRDVSLARGRIRVEVTLEPLALRVLRDEHTLIDGLTPFTQEGEGADRLIDLTEGVLVNETLADPRPLGAASVIAGNDAELRLRAGPAAIRIAIPEPDRIEIEVLAEPVPFRLGARLRAPDELRATGLGARHGEAVDQRGRVVRLGADRRYTGPDCPPEMLAEAGIPQGDYAPAPWVNTSPGPAVSTQAAQPHGCATTCGSPACRRCCPNGRTGTGRAATSISTSATCSTTSRATSATSYRWTRS